VVQTTAASQPLLLVHEGANYWQGPNVTNNAVSTPDAPANRILLDLEIIAYVKHTNNTTLNSLVSKNDGGTQRGYSLVFDANNLVLYYGLTTLNVASSTATIASGSTLWVRCTRNATTGQIQFFTSTNPATTNPQSVTWTQLGATISGLIGPINASGNLPLLIGGYISVNSGFSSLEKIYRLTLSNSIGGAPVVDFNPNQYNAANSQTQWTSSTGEVWSIQTGTAATGYKGVLVDRTIVQADGVNDLLLSSNVDISFTDKMTQFLAFKELTLGTTAIIADVGTTANRTGTIYDFTNVISNFTTVSGINNTYNTPLNSALFLLSKTIDRSESTPENEQNIYYNNILQTKTAVSANNTSGNFANGPIALFARNDNVGNFCGIANTFIVSNNLSNSTIRSSMYNYIKSINNNAF
jgi:hypothetical protein